MKTLVQKFLELNHYFGLSDQFEDNFSSHPNYPSLYAITDSLTLLEVENLAVKVPTNQFTELPEQFLTYYKNELVLLYKKGEKVVVETDKGMRTTLELDVFIESWNPVIVVVEPNTVERNVGFAKNTSRGIVYSLPFVVLLGASFLFHTFSMYEIIQISLATIGAFMAYLILQESLGLKTELASKICNQSTTVSCDNVIKSDYSKLFLGITFTDLVVVFFEVNLTALLINPVVVSPIVSLLGCVSIPFLLYSVWLQQFKLKKWCRLCLIVAAIILAQGSIIFSQKLDASLFTPQALFTYGFVLVLFVSIWSAIKPLLNKKQELETENKSLKRFKRNYKTFKALNSGNKSVMGVGNLHGIQIGNPDASMKLTLLLSPSCGHCHKAFKDAYELFQKDGSKVFVNILFNVNPENQDNKYLKVVKSLLQLNESNPQQALEAIKDWHIEQLGYDKWLAKWEVTSIDMKVNNEMFKQYEWCTVNSFNYTPVKLVNQVLLAEEYEISDLRYFVNELHEENTSLSDESLKIV